MMQKKWDPKLYEKTATIQHRLALDLIDRFVSLQDNHSILDVGCGDGFVTKQLAARIPNGSVVGIDPSEEMIKHALSVHSSLNLAFKCMGAEAIDVADQNDYVVSFSAMMWVKDQLKALQNIHRSLKSKGQFIVLFWPHTDYYWLPAENVIHSEKWSSRFKGFTHGFQYFDISGYRILLELIGFRVDHSESVFHDLRYESIEHYANVLKSFLPHLSYIESPEEKSDLLEDIGKQYSMMAGKDANGHYFGTTRHVEIVASKC